MRFLFFIFLSFNAVAQIGTGQWRLHVEAKRAIDVVAGNNTVFTAFQNGLLEYDTKQHEVSVWTKINGLSDLTISCIYFDNASNSLFIGYENGNFDKIKDNKVTNIPGIKLAQIQGVKRINKIIVTGNYAYLSTGFGIVKVDIHKEEVKDTWYPTGGNDPILDVAFRGDSVFALSAKKLYRARTNNPILADAAQWKVDTRLALLTADSYKEIEAIDNELFFIYSKPEYGKDSVFALKNNGNQLITNLPFSIEVNTISNQNGKLAVTLADGAFIYNANYSFSSSFNSYSFGKPVNSMAICLYDNATWIADKELGLVQYISSEQGQVIAFEGPAKNQFYSMDYSQGRNAFVGGGLSGNQNTYGKSGVLLLDEEHWSVRDNSNISAWENGNAFDYLSVAIHPTNKDQVAVGTFSPVPLTILNTATNAVDTFGMSNSPIKPIFQNDKRGLVSAVEYDEKGNLWILNGYSDKPLITYTKAKEWKAFDCGTSAKNRQSTKMVIDYNGNKWFGLADVGVIGYDDNKTILNTTDDKYVTITSGATTGALPSKAINALAVDFDNEIWIGTDNGFAILYNSKSALNGQAGQYNTQRIKVEINGVVDYVLGNTNITDIEVDGGNRKWFGTANAGILLLSADGAKVIHQFTAENSPLISNNIIDLQLNQATGELFIATDKGLVSYRTDATYEDPNYSEVNVFPNPARPEYDGPMTIQGIRYDSDVKITDVAGNLVYKTTSNGGTATWNCKTLSGERVKTGVYLIWTATNVGSDRKVGKVLVIN